MENKIEKPKRPTWFMVLLVLGLTPLLLWPFLMLGSLFMGDNPANEQTARILFYLLLSLPVILGVNSFISYRMFFKRKALAVTMSAIPFALAILLIVKIFVR
jgi:hypothetical protein